MNPSTTLEHELATFRMELPALLSDPRKVGQFVLVCGKMIDSFWPTMEAALAAGYDRFGLEPFLVKQVVADEKPAYFTRRAHPCR